MVVHEYCCIRMQFKSIVCVAGIFAVLISNLTFTTAMLIEFHLLLMTFPLLVGMPQLVGRSLHHQIIGMFIPWAVGVKCGLVFIRALDHPSGR